MGAPIAAMRGYAYLQEMGWAPDRRGFEKAVSCLGYSPFRPRGPSHVPLMPPLFPRKGQGRDECQDDFSQGWGIIGLSTSLVSHVCMNRIQIMRRLSEMRKDGTLLLWSRYTEFMSSSEIFSPHHHVVNTNLSPGPRNGVDHVLQHH